MSEDRIFCSIVLAVVTTVASLLVWGNVYKEIPACEYRDIENWSKNYPEIHGMILDATADGCVDNYEYRQIDYAIADIKKRKHIQNAIEGKPQ